MSLGEMFDDVRLLMEKNNQFTPSDADVTDMIETVHNQLNTQGKPTLRSIGFRLQYFILCVFFFVLKK